MDFQDVHDYAVKKSSTDYGSDVMEKINNKFVSSATGHLNYLRDSLVALTKFFETQKLAHDNKQDDWLDEFHSYVRDTVDGNGDGMQGLKKRLTIYFWNQEFKRDPHKKQAIALYLKYFIEYLRDNAEIVPIEEFLDIPADRGFNGNYFDKNYVFGELLEIVEGQIK